MSIANQLHTLGALMKTNLETKGITGLTGNEGLTTLTNKILEIKQGDGLFLFSDGKTFQKGDICNIYALLTEDGERVSNADIDLIISNVDSDDIVEYYHDFSEIPPFLYREFLAEPCTFSWRHTQGRVGVTDDIYGNNIIEIPVQTIIQENNISGAPLCNLVWTGTELKLYINGVDYTNDAFNGTYSYSVNQICIGFEQIQGGLVPQIMDVFSILGKFTHAVYIEDMITTGANGLASYSYSGVGAGDITVTASYRSLLQETYELNDLFFYDNCSSDKTSQFTPILCEGGTNPSIAFDTDNYVASGGSKTTALGLMSLPLPTDCEIECEVIPTSTSFGGAIGLALIKNTGNVWGFVAYNNGSSRVVEYRNSSWIDSSSVYNTTTLNTGVATLKIIKQGDTITFKGNNNNDIVKTISGYNYAGFMKGSGTLTIKKLQIKTL